MSISIVHNDPVVDQCGYCDNGIQGDQYCRYCGGDGVSVFDLSALATLAHNIAWGAALCRERANALDEAEEHRLYHDHGYRLDECWSPGCGRSAR